MKKFASRAFAVAVIATSSTIGLHARADDAVVAQLDDTTLKASDIKALVDALDPTVQKQLLADPATMSRLVRVELGRRAVLAQAKAQKWDDRPEVVAQLERLKNELIVNDYLATTVAPPADFPTDEILHKVYDANKDKWVVPVQYHLAQIYIAKPTGGSPAQVDAAKANATDLAKKAKSAGAGFADLARANSEDKASAANGGDIGWFSEGSLQPVIGSAVQNLPDKDVSPAIDAADGWHIVRLIEKKPATQRTFDEVKPAIVRQLRQQEASRLAQAYVDKLLNDKKIAVNEIALRNAFQSAAH